QIERDAALPEIDGVEQRAPLPPPLAGGRLDALEPHPVRALDRLHLDDVRSHRAQVLRRERSGPECGEIDDAKPGEWTRTALRGKRRRRLAGTPHAGMLPERGGRLARSQAARAPPIPPPPSYPRP